MSSRTVVSKIYLIKHASHEDHCLLNTFLFFFVYNKSVKLCIFYLSLSPPTEAFSPSCATIKFTSVSLWGRGRGSVRLFPGLVCQLFLLLITLGYLKSRFLQDLGYNFLCAYIVFLFCVAAAY